MKLSAVAPPHAVDALATILELQAHDETASTTIRDPGEAVGRHVADSLSALELPYVRDARRIADLGSGAGWPGLALAAALPDAHVDLVESAIRHCRYLERAVEVSGLANVTVVNARAETWPEGIGRNDIVTARALGALAVILEYAAPLLADGGHLIAWKGAASPAESAAGHAAADDPRPGAAPGRRRHPVPGCPRPHAARLPQDRAHAGALPAPAWNGHKAPARNLKGSDPFMFAGPCFT